MNIQKSWWIAGALIVTAAAWRVANWQFGIAPNLEVVTASALIAAVFLNRKMSVVVPVAIMAASDMIIGNSSILLFTWPAFAVIGLAGLALKRWQERPGRLMLGALGAGVASSVWFFAFTNFGVWATTDMYTHTWAGLMQCYYMGLPFYRTMLLGNLVLVPAYFAIALYGPALAMRLAKPVVVKPSA